MMGSWQEHETFAIRPAAGFVLLSLFFAFRFIAETKGKALEDMEAGTLHHGA